MSSRRQILLARVHWYLQSSLNTLLNKSQVIGFIIEVVVTDKFHCSCKSQKNIDPAMNRANISVTSPHRSEHNTRWRRLRLCLWKSLKDGALLSQRNRYRAERARQMSPIDDLILFAIKPLYNNTVPKSLILEGAFQHPHLSIIEWIMFRIEIPDS